MPNEWFPPPPALIVAVVAFALLLVLLWSWRGARPPRQGLYALGERLLEPAEFELLQALEQVVEPDQTVWARVRVGDIVRPQAGLKRGHRREAVAGVAAVSFDFLLCERAGQRPLLAIELDAAGEQRSGRQRCGAERARHHERVAAACADAGLPLLRIAAAEQYDTDDLRQRLATALTPPVSAPAMPIGPLTADGRREPILDLPDDPVAAGDPDHAPGHDRKHDRGGDRRR